MITTSQAYAEHQANIAAQLEAFERMLERHEKQRAEHPTDWGYCGDLGYVEERLGEALAHLGGCDDV